MKISILLIFGSFLCFSSYADGMKNFYTDECTGYPEGTKEQPKLWAHCCIKHDLAYWVSGSKEDRSNADKKLRACVAVDGGKFQARLMYTGVTLGHLSPIKAKTAWGWAYSKKARKKFSVLTSEEKKQALAQIYDADVPIKYIDQIVEELKLRDF